MTIFNEFGEHHTIIEIRSGAHLDSGEVEVISGSRDLGRIRELDAGEAGADTAVCDFVYRGFLPNGDEVTTKFADFEEALASVIANTEGLAQ